MNINKCIYLQTNYTQITNKLMDKIIAFEYVVKKLVDWYNEAEGIEGNRFPSDNDLSKLKLFKLHFFVSAVNASPVDANLLETFDKFYAMPYGHVEGEIYNEQSFLRFFSTSSSSLSLKSNIVFDDEKMFECWADELLPEVRNQIDEAIKQIKEKNFGLIKYTAFELVDLSHEWQSWKIMFQLAQDNGRSSLQIPTKLIQNERKIFSL